MLAVCIATLVPVPVVKQLPSYSDKIVHVGCYLLLGFLAAMSQPTHRTRFAAAAAMVGLGILIEIIQGQLPWRSFEWMDIVANTVGAAFGWLLSLFWLRRR